MVATIERPKPIIGPSPNTPEWHAFRKTGFGASEAAAIVGCDRYATARHIYERKLGTLVEEQPDSDAMRLGRKMEPVVVSEFVDRTGIAVAQYPCPVMRHAEHEFMLATPDALLSNDELLECKTTTFRMADEWVPARNVDYEGSDWMPDWTMMQVQQQIAVTGRDACHVAALFDGRTLRLRRVERNDAIVSIIVSAEQELWERIRDRRPPEPSWEHPRTVELIRELYATRAGGTVAIDEAYAELWEYQAFLGEEEKSIKKARDTIRAMLTIAIGDAETAVVSGADLTLGFTHVKETVVERHTRAAYSFIREIKPTKKKAKR